MKEVQPEEASIPESKRLFKFKVKPSTKLEDKLQTKLQSFVQLTSLPHPNKHLTNCYLHVPGKINFHELLSLPLQKQIQRQNSLKENQTFSLKFEPELSLKQSFKHHSKDSLNKIINKITSRNSRFLTRKNFTAQKGTRSKHDQNEQIEKIKQPAKTMYFRPIGKIARDYEQQNNERRSLQFMRNIKTKESNRLEMGTTVYKDKLLMLLKIRKQQRNERKSKSSLGNEYNSYRQINKFNLTEGIKEKYNQSKSFRTYRKNSNEESGTLAKLKPDNPNNSERQDPQNPNQLSPWYLMENGEDF